MKSQVRGSLPWAQTRTLGGSQPEEADGSTEPAGHGEDEFFYVMEGRMLMDVDGREPIELSERQGISVAAGTSHRPRAAERAITLLVEGAGTVPTGD